MTKGFKLKPKNHLKKKKVEKEFIWKESPYVKEKSTIVRPVYFGFMNYDEPPKIKFNVTPSLLWGDEIKSEDNIVFSDDE